jgi:hypothetical protein
VEWFKFVPVPVGSGWTGAYIGINQRIQPRSLIGSDEWCLSHDCQDAEEFEGECDVLIAELQELKQVARRKFSKIQE